MRGFFLGRTPTILISQDVNFEQDRAGWENAPGDFTGYAAWQ
jgi:hypothetical protein